MKTIVLSILSVTAACLALSHAQELQTITQASGPLTIPANSIVQILGVASGAYTSVASNWNPPSITATFMDATVVKTSLYQGANVVGVVNNNNLVGNVFTRVASISVKNGKTGYDNGDITVAVTVKIMSEASQVVSPPMILPVDDEIFSVSLETSTDMQDWVPAFPGDYLGSSNHRFFRVKAIQKPVATPAAK